MGNLLSFGQKPTQRDTKLLLLGLDAAGKTTFLYGIQTGKTVTVATTIPTIGFNVEEFSFGGNLFVAWDVGGRSRIRALWRHYYKETDGLIFMIDSNDKDRFEQVKDELSRMLSEDDLKNLPVLLFCNKQDLPHALSPDEVVSALELEAQLKLRIWKAFGCVATKGEGLHEGMKWLSQQVHERSSLPPATETKDDAGPPAENRSFKKPFIAAKLGYAPWDTKSNPTLQHFSGIKNGTECPFAKASKLWGGKPLLSPCSLEAQAKANAFPLTEFVHLSDQGENLDGFCVELDDERARAGGPEELGRCLSRFLTALSDSDPSGENTMRVNYIGSRGWRYRFNGADFFVTTFAPCYPVTSSRYAFGTGRAFVLLQPEKSFGRHGKQVGVDTPHTSWDEPKTMRDKTRIAYRDAGRNYHIPDTTKYPPAEHIVKPLPDDRTSPVVTWWKNIQRAAE